METLIRKDSKDLATHTHVEVMVSMHVLHQYYTLYSRNEYVMMYIIP